jgi:hypothetical protein
MDRRAIIAALALSAASCSSGVRSVEKDLAGLRASLVQGRYDEVWDGLSEGQKADVSREAFTAALEKDPDAVGDLVEVLDQALRAPEVTYSAAVTLEDGSVVVLVLEEGGWTFQTPVTTFYGQSTPREALESFIRAFKAGRWDVVAGLMPSKYSGEDDASVIGKAWGDPAGRAEIERLVKVIEEHVGDEYDVQGNGATLRHPEGQVTFLREGGQWVILDLD